MNTMNVVLLIYNFWFLALWKPSHLCNHFFRLPNLFLELCNSQSSCKRCVIVSMYATQCWLSCIECCDLKLSISWLSYQLQGRIFFTRNSDEGWLSTELVILHTHLTLFYILGLGTFNGLGHLTQHTLGNKDEIVVAVGIAAWPQNTM